LLSLAQQTDISGCHAGFKVGGDDDCDYALSKRRFSKDIEGWQ
jgi:hypothetical protein